MREQQLLKQKVEMLYNTGNVAVRRHPPAVICLTRVEQFPTNYRVGERAHAAVSPSPPTPSNTSVARTEDYTYAANAWASCCRPVAHA